MSKTIVSCAVTGNQTTLAQHPGLPCTPQQIAEVCIGAARADAAIIHIHVRYPDGRPSMEVDHYREVVDRIGSSGTDVIINLTTGPGQRFIPGKDDPSVAAPGTTLMAPMRRVEHVLDRADATAAPVRRPVSIGGHRVKTIDTHCHCIFEDALSLMGGAGQNIVPPTKGVDEHFLLKGVEGRLRSMDEMGSTWRSCRSTRSDTAPTVTPARASSRCRSRCRTSIWRSSAPPIPIASARLLRSRCRFRTSR